MGGARAVRDNARRRLRSLATFARSRDAVAVNVNRLRRGRESDRETRLRRGKVHRPSAWVREPFGELLNMTCSCDPPHSFRHRVRGLSTHASSMVNHTATRSHRSTTSRNVCEQPLVAHVDLARRLVAGRLGTMASCSDKPKKLAVMDEAGGSGGQPSAELGGESNPPLSGAGGQVAEGGAGGQAIAEGGAGGAPLAGAGGTPLTDSPLCPATAPQDGQACAEALTCRYGTVTCQMPHADSRMAMRGHRNLAKPRQQLSCPLRGGRESESGPPAAGTWKCTACGGDVEVHRLRRGRGSGRGRACGAEEVDRASP